MRAIPLAALLVLVNTPAGAQQASDSASFDVAEPPPLWVGARLSDLLVARRAGLLVSPAGGAVGSAARFRVRGPQTIFDNRMPLVILDGMRLDAASDLFGGAARLEDLNPEEIESIEVIPGAASTAVYGPGAANGVIVIKTRQGRRGSPRWEAYAEAGVRRPYRAWPTWYGGIDADNSFAYYRSGGCALPAVAQGSCVQDSVFRYNPYAYSTQLRTAVPRQYGTAVSGGLPRLDYFFSGELDGDGGLLALTSDEADRLTALGQPPRDATRHPEHFGGAHLRANLRLRASSRIDLAVRAARITSDLRVPMTPNLRFDPYPGDWFQPDNTQALRRWLGLADAEWRPVAGLSIHGTIGTDRIRLHSTRLQRWGEGPRSPGVGATPGFLDDAESTTATRTTGVSAVYEFGSSTGVSFRTRIGYEHASFDRDTSWFFAYLDSGTTTIDTTGPSSSLWGHGRGSDWGLYVQQQLDVKGRFEVTAGLRRDDFEFFDRAPIHGSLAASWLLGPTRVRVGYGSAGRRPNAPREQERTKELTAGFETSFLADRVQVGVTLYDMRSNVRSAIPLFPGGPPLPNPFPRAHITNRGIEIAVSGQVVRRAEAALAVTLTAWGNRNRVVEMEGPWIFGISNRYVPGYPAGGYWARQVVGFNDANSDGIIEVSEVTANPEFVWAGTPYPTQGAALTGDLTLRGGVRLGATLDYQAGHTAFNQAALSACAAWQCQALVDPATPLAQQAAAIGATSGPVTGFFEDADFLKLREVWISVAAPQGIAGALRARSATIALVGRNLRTWTSYTGIDPEPTAVATVAGAPETIADRLVMPRLPEWSLRLRLTY